MVNRANGTRANDHKANGNKADVVAPKISNLELRVHKMLLPKLSSSVGFSIHLIREGGIQAGSTGKVMFC